MQFAGKIAMVTGAAQGIGRAIAERLASEGATVVIADIQKEAADRTAAELPGTAHGRALDVTNVTAVRDCIDGVVAEFGRLDILVNNAGVGHIRRLEDISEEEFDLIFDVNVKGLFFCTQAAAAHMIAQRSGKIVNLASIAGRQGEALVSHYCASKAAVISLTQSTARYLAPYGVNVNAVAPGIVDTKFWEQVDLEFADIEGLEPGEPKRLRVATIPLGRIEKPDDVAKAVAFLASSGADYITGQTLNVEGGMIMN